MRVWNIIQQNLDTDEKIVFDSFPRASTARKVLRTINRAEKKTPGSKFLFFVEEGKV